MKFLASIKKVTRVLLPGFALNKIICSSRGIGSEVYKLSSPSENVYLRILNNSEANYGLEVDFLNLLAKKDLPVPRVLAYLPTAEFFAGRSCLILSEILGRPLYRTRISLKEQKNIIYQAGRELALVHSVPTLGFGFLNKKKNIFYGSDKKFSGFVFGDLEIDLQTMVEEEFFSSRRAAGILEKLEGLKNNFDQLAGVVSHGDFHTKHLYYKNGAYSGLIDFSDLLAADRIEDLAHFKVFCPTLFPTLLQGYEEVFKLTNNQHSLISVLSFRIALFKAGWVIRSLIRPRDKKRFTKTVRDEFENGMLKTIKKGF